MSQTDRKTDVKTLYATTIKVYWGYNKIQPGWICAGEGGSAASASPGFMLGLGLAQSCNNEFDWLFSGEKTYPIIPGDIMECTISPQTSMHGSYLNKVWFGKLRLQGFKPGLSEVDQ